MEERAERVPGHHLRKQTTRLKPCRKYLSTVEHHARLFVEIVLPFRVPSLIILPPCLGYQKRTVMDHNFDKPFLCIFEGHVSCHVAWSSDKLSKSWSRDVPSLCRSCLSPTDEQRVFRSSFLVARGSDPTREQTSATLLTTSFADGSIALTNLCNRIGELAALGGPMASARPGDRGCRQKKALTLAS